MAEARELDKLLNSSADLWLGCSSCPHEKGHLVQECPGPYVTNLDEDVSGMIPREETKNAQPQKIYPESARVV